MHVGLGDETEYTEEIPEVEEYIIVYKKKIMKSV